MVDTRTCSVCGLEVCRWAAVTEHLVDPYSIPTDYAVGCIRCFSCRALMLEFECGLRGQFNKAREEYRHDLIMSEERCER